MPKVTEGTTSSRSLVFIIGAESKSETLTVSCKLKHIHSKTKQDQIKQMKCNNRPDKGTKQRAECCAEQGKGVRANICPRWKGVWVSGTWSKVQKIKLVQTLLCTFLNSVRSLKLKQAASVNANTKSEVRHHRCCLTLCFVTRMK